MKSEILGYSRSGSIFAGLALDGSTLREDLEDNRELHGKKLTNMEIPSQAGTAVPAKVKALIAQLNRVSTWEKK